MPRKRSWSSGLISKVEPGCPLQRAVARARRSASGRSTKCRRKRPPVCSATAYGPPLCFCPAPKVEDYRGADAEHFVRGPQQAAFKDVSLAVSVGFTPSRSEERNHPLVGGEPDCLVLVRDLPSQGRLAHARQADSQVQCGRFGHQGKPDTVAHQGHAHGMSGRLRRHDDVSRGHISPP
jgi:hypothetical protein